MLLGLVHIVPKKNLSISNLRTENHPFLKIQLFWKWPEFNHKFPFFLWLHNCSNERKNEFEIFIQVFISFTNWCKKLNPPELFKTSSLIVFLCRIQYNIMFYPVFLLNWLVYFLQNCSATSWSHWLFDKSSKISSSAQSSGGWGHHRLRWKCARNWFSSDVFLVKKSSQLVFASKRWGFISYCVI